MNGFYLCIRYSVFVITSIQNLVLEKPKIELVFESANVFKLVSKIFSVYVKITSFVYRCWCILFCFFFFVFRWNSLIP